MSDGYKLESVEALDEFNKALGQREDRIREAGQMIGDCVADPGIFGIVGEVFGAGASAHCDKASHQLGSYADTVVTFQQRLTKIKQTYQQQEQDVADSISGYEV